MLPFLVLRPRRKEGDAFFNAGGDDILPLGVGHRVGDGPDALDGAFDGGGIAGLDHRGGGFLLLDLSGLHFGGGFLDFFGLVVLGGATVASCHDDSPVRRRGPVPLPMR